MLEYIGNGEFIPGVPARDLTGEEVKALGGEQALIGSGLYRKPAPQDKKQIKQDQPTADPKEG